MVSYDALRIRDWDHLEFAVQNLEDSAHLYTKMGFEHVASREIRDRGLRSYLMAQGSIRILLSHSTLTTDSVHQFVKTHGDGVISVALLCEDAVSALEIAVGRGAELALSPRSFQREFGEVQQASIRAFGDVLHTFVSRKGDLFAEGFEGPCQPQVTGMGLTRIDHITNNVEKDRMDEWAEFYEKIFGLKNTRFFDIRTERTGLYSKVMQSPDGLIKFPVNEPTESASQIQEFLDINHGPGVQHVALSTETILSTVNSLRRTGLPFLEAPPSTYYEELPTRIPGIREPMTEIRKEEVLVDGDAKGYLLQIFTQPVVGPFFYEVIQRRGNDGFGEGNFKALFEAIERDQIKRGVLKA